MSKKTNPAGSKSATQHRSERGRLDLEDMQVLEPTTETVRFQGQDVRVQELVVRQIPPMLRALRGVDLSSGIEDTKIVAFIAEHGEAFIDAVSIASGLPRETVEAGNPAEFLRFATAIVGINRDFFVQRIMPMIQAANLSPAKH